VDFEDHWIYSSAVHTFNTFKFSSLVLFLRCHITIHKWLSTKSTRAWQHGVVKLVKLPFLRLFSRSFLCLASAAPWCTGDLGGFSAAADRHQSVRLNPCTRHAERQYLRLKKLKKSMWIQQTLKRFGIRQWRFTTCEQCHVSAMKMRMVPVLSQKQCVGQCWIEMASKKNEGIH